MKLTNPFPDKFDALSYYGAKMIANHITNYWAARGFHNVVAMRFSISDTASYGVKSNLVNGLPPGAHGRSTC